MILIKSRKFAALFTMGSLFSLGRYDGQIQHEHLTLYYNLVSPSFGVRGII